MENKSNTPKHTTQDKPEKKIDYGRELVMTFSNKSSLFSSKKIERFFIIYTLFGITISYIIYNIQIIKPLELIEIIAAWLAYAGYNSFQNYKDKKLDAAKSEGAPIEQLN